MAKAKHHRSGGVVLPDTLDAVDAHPVRDSSRAASADSVGNVLLRPVASGHEVGIYTDERPRSPRPVHKAPKKASGGRMVALSGFFSRACTETVSWPNTVNEVLFCATAGLVPETGLIELTRDEASEKCRIKRAKPRRRVVLPDRFCLALGYS